MIVLVCAAGFLASLVFGSARGVLVRWVRRSRLNRRINRQHLLRAIYETLEASAGRTPVPADAEQAVAISELLTMRSWSMRRLQRGMQRAKRDGLLRWPDRQHVGLTDVGFDEAARLTHQHRLWELYLITYADTAPNHVDRDADAIEHVLEPEIITRLETLLKQRWGQEGIPESPHDLAAVGAASSPTVPGGDRVRTE